RHAAPAPPPALPLAAAENSPAFLAVLRGPDYVVESANQRFQDVVGGRDVLGHPLLEVVPELEAQGFRELLERVGHSAQPFVGESMTAVLPHPSDERPYEARFDFIYQPMRSAHGEVDRILVHGVDVTQQQRWEARDSFLLALEDALQHVTEPQQIVDTSVRLLGEHLQASRCAYGLMDDHGDGIRVVSDHVHDVPSLQGHFLLQGVAEGLMEALRDNRPWLLNDADAPGAQGYLAEHYRRIGMRASLAVPLHKNGRLVAAMGVHQRVPRQWLSTEVELVRLVGARCWESLQRARMQ
ncbi:PAS domain-containing protein, partial [Xanthomonas sp. Kuri4-1]